MKTLTLLALVCSAAFGQVLYEDFSSIRFGDGTSTLSCPTSTWRGTWSGGTTYAQCDVVFYSGGPPSIFVSRINGNVGNAPPVFAASAVDSSWGVPLSPVYTGENSAQEQTFSTSATDGHVNVKLNSSGASGHYFILLKKPSSGADYTYHAGYGLSPYLQSWIKSGAWDSGINRMSFKYRCDQTDLFSDVSHTVEVGTYIRPHDESDTGQKGQHYYHFLAPNVYADNWIYATINTRPEHRVGASPGTLPRPNDPEWVNPYGSQVHYFDGLTDLYFDWVYGQNVGATCQIGDIRLSTASGEVDGLTMNNSDGIAHGYVGAITAQYSGPIGGYPNGRYEVVWQAPAMVTGGQQYNIRYGTSDMHSVGFAAGTSGGTITGPDGSLYTTTRWYSTDMPQSSSPMYVAIQPVGQSEFNQVVIPGAGASGAGSRSGGKSTSGGKIRH